MQAYIIRRLLIMIPTFFGISIVLFLVLNLAPGRPGATQQSTDFASNVKSQQSQESFRIFREQFNLDKPIFFNTRFLVTKEDLLPKLRTTAGIVEAKSSERIEAQDTLEDVGSYAVPSLVQIMNDADRAGDKPLRDAAVYFLRLNAQRPLTDPFNPRPNAKVRAYNREVDEDNARIRELRYALDDPEEKKRPVIAEWQRWFTKNSARFQLSSGEKFRAFFLDTRFAKYWQNLLKLDFGVSLVTREPVVATLVSKLKYSLSLSVTSLVLAYVISIPLGIFSAVKKDSTTDRVLTVALFMLYSLPSFFIAALLLRLFSEGSDWEALRRFPTGGFRSADYMDLTTIGQIRDVVWHLALPLLCLTYGSLAALSRYMRTGLLDVIRSDYIRTARAKGLSERVVIGKHALRNGLLPILTLLAGLLPAILGGSVIIEYIFGIPGMGLWTIDAIYQRDYNVIMAVELFSAILVLVGILLTDLSYALVDPRIRYE